jgi:glycosyltransferase involved in cell wall biosynthesis
MSVIVVIPAYNAGRHVRGVIERLNGAALPDLERIIVVDDGSTDDSRAVLARLPRLRCPIDRVDRSSNGGYGAAMKDGLQRAADHDPDVVACVHADGQYSPEVLPGLALEMRARRLDVLQGSRIAGGAALSGGMPLYKYVANSVLNVIENRVLGLGLTDYHSGYMLYGRGSLRAIPFHKLSDGFEFDLEVIASARAHGLSVSEAPIPTHYGDEKSHLQPALYGLQVLRVMWNYRRGRYAPT